MWGCIQKFPDWVDNEINNYNVDDDDDDDNNNNNNNNNNTRCEATQRVKFHLTLQLKVVMNIFLERFKVWHDMT
jgi:hypothetical protein